MVNLELLLTLCPSFPHFQRFARDERVAGIRINSAQLSQFEVVDELRLMSESPSTVPLYFDIKGRQLRVEEVIENPDYLEFTLNHPIRVETPCLVIFKGGKDKAILGNVSDGGRRLLFSHNPEYKVRAGESLHIRHPSLEVLGPTFTQIELDKIKLVTAAGFTRYYLSYVESQADVESFLDLVGRNSEVHLKIENQAGLHYVQTAWRKRPNLFLVAARGDMYLELPRPHQIMGALKLIIEKDPEACVGSRLLLSVATEPVPSCADFLEMAWLYDIGYRKMLLCDELCLQEELLGTAVNAFESFREAYGQTVQPTRTVRGWRGLPILRNVIGGQR